jgi:hypothetical protein
MNVEPATVALTVYAENAETNAKVFESEGRYNEAEEALVLAKSYREAIKKLLDGAGPEPKGSASVSGTWPRITLADIEDNIESEHYFTAYDAAKSGRITRDEPAGSEALKLLTICVLVLRNGYTVVGHGACINPDNFDAETGRLIARENAVRQVWSLMGYELRSRLANSTFTGQIEGEGDTAD